MSADLDWVITIGVLCANVTANDQHILDTAMTRHPNAPWALAFQGLYAQGYNVEWALARIDGNLP